MKTQKVFGEVKMLNKFITMGRLVRDPELRQTTGGVSIASFAVAVERDYGGKGEKQTDFIDCVAWRQTGEFISKYFFKGDMICLEGRIETRTWEKDGQKHKATELNVSSAYFCGSKSSGGQAPAVTAAEVQPFKEISDEDGDLPF